MPRYFSKNWIDFIWVMTHKEIKARYKRAFLGFLWIFLNPLLQMIVIGYIFQFFVPVKIDHYFNFLFSGLLPWNFISYTVLKCTPLIYNERSLIQKAKFPREALVLSIIFSNLFHFLISIGILLIFTILFGSISIAKIALLIFAIFIMTIFVTGLSFLLSALYVKYRDIKFIVNALVPLWFYATPVVYTRSLLAGWLDKIIQFNPITGIIELFQYIFTDAVAVNQLVLGKSIIISVVVFILGIYVFSRESEYFDDWL